MAEIKAKNCIINIPDNASGSIPVFVLYPGIAVTCGSNEKAIGINPAGGKHIGRAYMPPAVRRGVPDWFNKYVLVFPNTHVMDFATVQKEYKAELEAKKLTESTLNLSVFSGSGSNGTIPYSKLNLKTFIIMDAVVSNSLINGTLSLLSKGTKVFYIYRESNWGSGKPSYFAKSFPDFEKQLKEKGLPESQIANVGANATKYGFPGLSNLCGQSLHHMVMPERSLSYWKSDIESVQTSTSAPPATENKGQGTNPVVLEDKPVASSPPQDRPKINRDFKFNVETENTFKVVGTSSVAITASQSLIIGDLVIAATASLGEPQVAEEWDFTGEEELDEEYGEESFETLPVLEAEEQNSWTVELETQSNKVIEELNKKPIEKSSDGTEAKGASVTVHPDPNIKPGKYDLEIITGDYKTNSGSPVTLCAVEGKPVNLQIASAYLDMKAAAKKDGVRIEISSAYRDPYREISFKTKSGQLISSTSQKYLYDGYIAKRPGFNLAAKPGASNHGNGIALDLNAGGKSSGRYINVNEPVFEWLVKNSWKFGFVRTVPNEEWHFDYRPDIAKKGPYAFLKASDSVKFYSKKKNGDPWNLDKIVVA